MAINFEG